MVDVRSTRPDVAGLVQVVVELVPQRLRLERRLGQVERLQETINTLLAVARDAPRSGTRTPLAASLAEIGSRWRPRFTEAGRAQNRRVEITFGPGAGM